MTQEAIKGRESAPSPTLTVATTNLLLGHEIGLFVDRLGLGRKVGVTLRLRPTPEDKTAGHLLISGTPEQLDVFRRALNLHQESIAAGLSGRVLDTAMNHFLALQAIRYNTEML